jgi:hypothetical protein
MLSKSLYTIERDNGTLHIYGNNHARDFIYWHELTESEQKELDWVLTSDTMTPDDWQGFRYKGNVYSLDDFMRAPAGMFAPYDFDGYMSDSFFSGILIRLTEDNDRVLVYTYIS